MNTGIFPLQDASGSNAARQVFCETVQLGANASSARQAINISPKPGVNTHYITLVAAASAVHSGLCRVTLNGAFPDGYTIVLIADHTGVGRLPSVEVFADNATIYIAPRTTRPAGETATLVRVGGVWRRVAVAEETSQRNSLVSSVQAAMNYRVLGTVTGTATNSGTHNASQVIANQTVANSTAMRYGQIGNTASGGRSVTRSVFDNPFALGMTFESQLSNGTTTPSTTAIMRCGMIAAWQNIANDGTPSAMALGFQINNAGDWSGFLHNGTSLTTTAAFFNQGDLGGGQGAQNIQSVVYWSPSGVAEWVVLGVTRFRQEGVAYSLPGAQYSALYFSAATGASTGTGNVSLAFLDARYYSA